MNECSNLIDAAAFSVAYLRAHLFGSKADLSRPLAVMLLAGKRYRTKVADMKRLLTDEREAPRVRELAALVLARISTPAAASALVAGLESTDPIVLGGVVRALALVGEASALPAIASLAQGQTPLANTAAWAARLLRYRSGQEGDGIPKGAPPLRPDPATAGPIATKPATAAALAEARRMLAEVHPSFTLDGKEALTFTCGDRRLMVLLDREGVHEGLAPRMLARKALVGVVAEYTADESEDWEIAYLVLSEPHQANQARIVVVSMHGRLVMDGTAVVKEETADFEIVAVEFPGAVPIEIAGTIAGGRVWFQRALVEPTRSRSRVPTLVKRSA